jgi:hypothetical protein
VRRPAWQSLMPLAASRMRCRSFSCRNSIPL